MTANLFLIVFYLFLGWLLKVSGKFPKEAAQVFNIFVIWISLPALILVQIPVFLSQNRLSVDLLLPMSMAWIQFLLSCFVFYWIGKVLKWERAEIGALILTAGLGNTAFMGYPILESLFGQEGLRIGILVDQPGTFFVLSTLGVIVGTLFSSASGKAINWGTITKNIVRFPPFFSLIVAVLWYMSGTYSPAPVAVLSKLSATLVPLALIAVGLQLEWSWDVLKRKWRYLGLGLMFKLILAPVFFIFFYSALSIRGLPAHVAILESAMPPMITAAVVAKEFGLCSEISNLMVGVGTLTSIISLYFFSHLPLLKGLN